MALTAMRAGQVGVVCETCLDPRDAAMLRAMGLRPRAQVRVCRLGQPCIIEVVSGGRGCCRIGLAWDLASRVMIGVAVTGG
ncbi:MAG: ferrous iron transport protein A [Phycisphaeraceae bacterium]|nr:ferrous iron transport protein A [Phycisphaeraceae bacterium]